MPRPEAIEPHDASGGSAGGKLFVSYSRKDRVFAEQLAPALEARRQHVWIDLQDIRPSEEWLAAIHAAIEGADAVVFVVSSDSLDPASVCIQEIDYAALHNKRLIPVICRPVDTRSTSIPDAVGKLNWISFLDPNGFDHALEELLAAIATDLDWVKSHTRYLERAVEWDALGRDDSFVLQKNDLAAAERWLALGAANKEPRPTPLQTQYILESRAVASGRRRRLMLFGSIAAVLVAVGATVAIYQYRQAEERRTLAQARDLAAEALFESERHLERAVPLAQQGYAIRVLPETANSALAVGQATAQVVAFLRGHRGAIRGICFLADGDHLVTTASDGRTILWALGTHSPVQVVLEVEEEPVAIACSPSVADFVTATGGGKLSLWTLQDGRAVRSQEVQDEDGFTRLQFSPDGAFLASSSWATVKLRMISTLELVDEPREHLAAVTALAVSADAERIAVATAGSDDQACEITLWARGETAPRFTALSYTLGVASVSIHEEGDRITAVGIDALFEAWDAEGTEIELELPSEFQTGDSPVSTFDAGGRRVLLVEGRAGLLVSEDGVAASYWLAQRLANHASTVSALSFDDTRPRVASGSEDGMVIVHGMSQPDAVVGGWLVPGFDVTSTDVTLSADGRIVVIGAGASSQVITVPNVSAAPQLFGGAPLPVPEVRAQRRLAVAEEQDQVILRDTETQGVLERIAPDPGEYAVGGAVTPDGQWWVAASENAVRLARVGEHRSRPLALPSGFGVITAVSISDDGRLIAVAGGDALHALAKRFGMPRRSILIVDVESAKPIGRPLPGSGAEPVEQLQFSPDGERLLARTPVSAVVWTVGAQSWLQQACALVHVAIEAGEWQRILPGIAYPDQCQP